MVSLCVSFTPLESLQPSCLLEIREIVWRALWCLFLRLQRPPFRLCLSPFRHPCKCLVLLASISPEFLAFVIQAIQTPISAIVQQSLAAVVSALSVSQGFPTIAAQGSSLAARSSGCSTSGYANERIIRYVVVSCHPIFLPVFSLASLSSIASCSLAVYSLPTPIHSALASQPIIL